MLLHTGDKPVGSKNGLLTTPAYKPGKDATPQYALEGSIAVAGSSVKWLRDQVGLIKDADEIGQLANSVKDTGGVYFVTVRQSCYRILRVAWPGLIACTILLSNRLSPDCSLRTGTTARLERSLVSPGTQQSMCRTQSCTVAPVPPRHKLNSLLMWVSPSELISAELLW